MCHQDVDVDRVYERRLKASMPQAIKCAKCRIFILVSNDT